MKLTTEQSGALCGFLRTLSTCTGINNSANLRELNAFLTSLNLRRDNREVDSAYKRELRRAHRKDDKRSPSLQQLMDEAQPFTGKQVQRLEAFSKQAPKHHPVHMLLIDHHQHCDTYHFDAGLHTDVLKAPADWANERTYRAWKRRRNYGLRLLAKI
jgi:hypothetical protein